MIFKSEHIWTNKCWNCCVLSREVSAGILHYINNIFVPDAVPTIAIFKMLFADWFKILSNCYPAQALYENNINANKDNMFRILLFANVFLKSVVMSSNRNNCWTQVQIGVLSNYHACNKIANCLFSNIYICNTRKCHIKCNWICFRFHKISFWT